MSKGKQNKTEKSTQEKPAEVLEFVRLRNVNCVKPYRFSDYAGADGKVVGQGSVVPNNGKKDVQTTEKGIEEMANEI